MFPGNVVIEVLFCSYEIPNESSLTAKEEGINIFRKGNIFYFYDWSLIILFSKQKRFKNKIENK